MNKILQTVYAFLKILPTLALVILTGFYVNYTYQILKTSRKQADIMEKTSKHSIRAYLYVQVVDFIANPTQTYSINAANHTVRISSTTINGEVKFNLRNEGQTPAFPVFWDYCVDSLSAEQLNLRENLLSAKSVFFQSTIHFPEVISKNYDYPFGYSFKDTQLNKFAHVYVHVYFIYKDVFNDCHDFYSVIEYAVDLKDKSSHKFPPFVSIKTLSNSEYEIIKAKIKKYTNILDSI